MSDLSPVLELAVRLLARGEEIPCHLCNDIPSDVADIDRCSLGHGTISAEGGLVRVLRNGLAQCLAYDVRGQLVVSMSAAMPLRLREKDVAKVGPLALGKHGTLQ